MDTIEKIIAECGIETQKIHKKILDILQSADQDVFSEKDDPDTHTLSELAKADQYYQQDVRDMAYLEQRYQLLNIGSRSFLDDYIACIQTAAERYSELSYLAGMEDAIKLLKKLNYLPAE